MSTQVQYLWTDAMVGERLGPEILEEGDRSRPASETSWGGVETLSLDRLKEIQLHRLKFLLSFTYERSRFYRELWDTKKIRPSDVRSLEDLPKLPVVTKYDFEKDQAAHPPFGTAPTSPPNEHLKYWQTSGTTARPRIWLDTRQDWENGILLYTRSLYGHGVRPGWRGFFAFGFPPFIGFWLCFAATEAMGCQVVPKGTLPTTAWLQVMQRIAGTAPAFLCSTPTYAIRQMEAAKELGINPAALGMSILTLAAEPGACVPATNRLLSQGWNAKIHDILGVTETSGPILFSCRHQAEMTPVSDHINIDYFIVELLDPDTLEPVPEGSPGTTCVTALGRYGMPAVRFLVGDHLQIDEHPDCPCGRTLPLAVGGAAGRADDALFIKGIKLYPSLVETSVRSLPGLGVEYRLQKKGDQVVVLVEAEPQVSEKEYPELARKLQEDIRLKATLTLPVEVHPAGAFPRLETKTPRIIKA
jgi:phenylacetate-CoA ligase